MVVTNINSLNVIAAAPQQTRNPETSDGFSETLDSVNKSSQGSSFKTEDTYSYTKQAGEAANETETADVDLDTEFSYSEVASTEVISVVEKAMEMLKVEIEADGGNEEITEDDILDMLIKIIDKMQEDEESESCDAAIEMLLAILGTENFRSEPTSIEITAVTGEISEISFEVSGTVTVSEPVMTEAENAPTMTAETEAAIPVTAELPEAPVEFTAEVPEIKAEQESARVTENVPENAPETVEQPESKPMAAEVDKLLSDILEKAKKELGLTEVKVTNNTPAEDADVQADIAPKQEIPMNISRKDSTDELRTILGDDNSADNTQTATETGNAVHMAQNLVEGRMTSELNNTEVLQPEAQAEVRAPEIQAGEQILARMESLSNGETEFTMVLNPESLGKITVKLLTVGERVAVEITAEKASTQQLLDARGESLQNMLRDNGVQLERYQVVAESDNAELMQESYDGSSRNPYFREDENNSEENDGEDSFYDLLQSL